MFHPKHVEPFTGNKILYKKSVILLELFLKIKPVSDILGGQVTGFHYCDNLHGGFSPDRRH
jgi:hypothetical protein